MAVWSTVNRAGITNRLRIEAEFYRPHYLACHRQMLNIPHFSLRQKCELITDGTHFTPHYKDSGVRFYSAVNVLEGRFDYDGAFKWITPKEHSEIHRRCPVQAEDVLLRKVGVGPRWSCVVPKGLDDFSIFVSVALIRPKKSVNPYFLSAFINTKQGQVQLLRLNKGSSQPDLHLEDIGELLVPDFDSNKQEQIAKIVKNAERVELKARNAYIAAERMLAEALKLDDLKLERPLSYTAKFSDVLREGRTDADYFQVPYVQMHKHLDKLNTVRLSTLVDFAKGIEVGSGAYVDEGKLFMRVSNLTVRGLKFNTSDRFVSESTYELLKSTCQPKVGELLLTKDGSPGVCWVVDREIESLMSGAIVRMSLKNREVPAEYLALAINSKLCQMQVEQNASGALILHWKLPLIKRLRVPLCDQETMKAIAKLVKESKKQQAKSEALLAEAKATVERLIEAAADRM